jgi:CRISPR-associated protein Cas1
MQAIARRALHETDLDRLRGHEGEAAALYFEVFGHALRVTDQGLAFRGRSRRPPMDPPNALLSFVYTLLVHDCRGALEGVGLDPAAGFLHRLRPGRPSLALDLMEELRAPMADRLALSLLNRREVGAGDFRIMENGAVLLKDDSRKTVLTAWQERKREEIEHPFLKERAPLGLLPHLQAALLARTLRGDLDAYPALIWR